MPMTWNPEADAKLLCAIINVSKPKLDYDALAEYVGPECTAYAIQHRIRKLQARAPDQDGERSAQTTPKKRKSPSKKEVRVEINKDVDRVQTKKAKKQKEPASADA